MWCRQLPKRCWKCSIGTIRMGWWLNSWYLGGVGLKSLEPFVFVQQHRYSCLRYGKSPSIGRNHLWWCTGFIKSWISHRLWPCDDHLFCSSEPLELEHGPSPSNMLTEPVVLLNTPQGTARAVGATTQSAGCSRRGAGLSERLGQLLRFIWNSKVRRCKAYFLWNSNFIWLIDMS